MNWLISTSLRRPKACSRLARGDDGFSHGAMAAGAAEMPEGVAHQFAGAFDVFHVAYRNDQIAAENAGYHGPLHPAHVQAKLGKLR